MDEERMKTGNSEKSAPFRFFCWLYIALGLISGGVGLFLLFVPLLIAKGTPRTPVPGMALIGGVCLVFGVIRIVNGVYHLRRLARLAQRSGTPVLKS